MNKSTESQLLNDIIKQLYPFVHLRRANVGSVKTADGRRFSSGLPAGFPDLFGTLSKSKNKYGVAVPVFIECKLGYNKPSEKQERFIADEIEKGSIAGVAYSVQDAIKLISPHLQILE